MFVKKLPSAEYLHECFSYDLKTGALVWKTRPRKHFATDQSWGRWNTLFAGIEAGNVDNLKGYRHVSVNWKDYTAHRLIWKLMTGMDPIFEVDHKDGNYSNNSWSNLRAATDGEQRWNSVLLSTNKSGRRGVVWNKKLKKWQTGICVRGVRRHLGVFFSLNEASAVYEAAAREAHGEFYRQPQQR